MKDMENRYSGKNERDKKNDRNSNSTRRAGQGHLRRPTGGTNHSGGTAREDRNS